MIEGNFGNLLIAAVDINLLKQKRLAKKQFEDQKSAISAQNTFSINVQKPNFDSIRFDSNLLEISYTDIEKDQKFTKFNIQKVEQILYQNSLILNHYSENLKQSDDYAVSDEFSSTQQINAKCQDIKSCDQTNQNKKQQLSFNDGFTKQKAQPKLNKIIASPTELENIRAYFSSHNNQVNIETIKTYIDIFQTKDPQKLYKSLQ